MNRGAVFSFTTITSIENLTLNIFYFFFIRRRLSDHRFRPDQASLSSSLNTTWGNKFARRSMKEKLILRDIPTSAYDFEPEDEFGLDSNVYEVTVNASDGRALSQAFHSNRTSYTSNPDNGFINTTVLSNGVVDANRSSTISESENGDVFLNSTNTSNYSSTDNGNVIVNEINFTRNGSFRHSYHDTSISSNQSETEIT